MDKTKLYIEMCSKAKEIQRDWKPQKGDLVKPDNFGEPKYISNIDYVESKVYLVDFGYDGNAHINNCIWLPSQGQLQEMVKLDHDIYLGAILSAFMRWYNENQITLSSMEQLWLSFAMEEIYNKIWKDGEWRTISQNEKGG